MAEHNAAERGFSFRPLSTRAVCIMGPRRESSVPSLITSADTAVLKLRDQQVIVGSLQVRADRSITGEIRGFGADGPDRLGSLRIGDRLHFRELHVFTYRVPQTDLFDASAGRRPRRQRLDSGHPRAASPSRSLVATLGAAAAFSALIALPLGYAIGKIRSEPRPQPAATATDYEAPLLRMDYELRGRD